MKTNSEHLAKEYATIFHFVDPFQKANMKPKSNYNENSDRLTWAEIF